MEIRDFFGILLVWGIVDFVTFLVMWADDWEFSSCLLCAITAPVSWLILGLAYLGESRKSPHSPTELGGGGVPLVRWTTRRQTGETPVNKPVNEGVNKPPVYEYMDVFTPKTDISILRELGKQGWKAIMTSAAKREDDQPALWVLLMREVRSG